MSDATLNGIQIAVVVIVGLGLIIGLSVLGICIFQKSCKDTEDDSHQSNNNKPQFKMGNNSRDTER